MEIGLVKKVNIDEEVRESYLSYAMSVIVSRALPDARDGLKPVQRRILYAMYDMGLRPNTSYKKSARVVGEVLGKYHPHSDQAVYDAMVRLAQDFSMRYELVDGQGNFGSVDGDAAAAMRYTEARMSNRGFDLLEDIEKNTVNFATNFDDSLKEPSVLPATIPNLLVNGSSGIAVGMATSIPPHNLGEVIDALVYMIDNWKKLDDIAVPDLMNFIKGPDFPTGGLVYRFKERKDEQIDAISSAYGTGRGRVTVQAKAHVEQMGRNKSRIVITEIPYQTNKTNLLGRIADLHRDGKIEGLTDLRDESDRNGMRIIIETTRNVEAKEVLANLFRLTPLQSTFSISLLALVNGAPRILTLKQALKVYLDHRLEVIHRRTEYDLEKAKNRAHILEGLLVALDHLDEVIALIRKSRTVETARQNLRKEFKLTQIQAQAILDMQLRRLAALERRKIQDEYKEIQKVIRKLEKLLSKPALMRQLMKEELTAVREKYADPRRTQIIESTSNKSVTASNLLPDQTVWVMVGEKGTLGRTTNREMVKIPLKPAEQPTAILEANTQDILYLFAADGRCVALPVYQLPQSRDIGKGTHWAELTGFTRRNHLAAALVCPPNKESGYITLVTLTGMIKRIRIEDMPGFTTDPFVVMNVNKNDSLGWARISDGKQEIVLASANGQLIRFKEDSVRDMGLQAGGVYGMKLANEADGIVSMDLAVQEALVWSITDNGLAKTTPMKDYPVQGRHGQGVRNMNLPKESEEVAAVVIVSEKETLLVKTASGSTKKVRVDKTYQGARAVKPKAAFSIGGRNRVTGAVRISERPQDDATNTAVPEQLSLLGG